MTRTPVRGRGVTITIVLATALGCASGGSHPAADALSAVATGDTALPTPAERSADTATTPSDTALRYLQELVRHAAARHPAPSFMSVGATPPLTTEGRRIWHVVLSRPMVGTAAEAHASGRPVVYIEANIHGGEVEGKEAVLALIRDLVVSAADRTTPSLLDSVVIVVVPVYNADGNDHFGPQAVNRPEQNGPERVGERANGQHLDLNRDFVKAEAPETQMTMSMFERWDPDVFVDLHTTDGSFHGYALTYAPPLNPAALFTGSYTRDSLLPELRRRLRDRHHMEIFDYGNFQPERSPGVDTAPHSWQTYDSRPRFGTNYVGLRNRIGILSEAYSHDPFGERIAVTYAFVREILSLVAERRTSILRLTSKADSAVPMWAAHPDVAPAVPLVTAFAPARGIEPVLVEDLEPVASGDTTTLTQPGVPRGLRRTGRVHPVRMPVIDRFETTLADHLPWAYLVPPGNAEVTQLLRRHGIAMQPVRADTAIVGVERFVADSVGVAPQAFQGHHEVRVRGHWLPLAGATRIPAGTTVVPCAQPRGILAMYLLDPRSEDGLVTWNIGDQELEEGHPYAVTRVRVHAAH